MHLPALQTFNVILDDFKPMKIFWLAILRNLPISHGFTPNLAFFGRVCTVSLDVILILSRKVLFRRSQWLCMAINQFEEFSNL